MTDHLIIAQPRLPERPLLSAGAVRFTGPLRGRLRPQMALVVKLAYSFAPGPGGQLDGPAVLVDSPLPERDRSSALPGAGGEDELAYPSDFVPRKAAVDVLLTGHAYAEQPAYHIGAAVSVPGLRRAFSVVAGGYAPRLPISSAYLRAEGGAGGADPVWPQPAGAARSSHDLDFDFAAYASAVASQRAPEFVPGATIELVGLSPRAPRRLIEVPKVAPRAVLASRFGVDIDVQMACDTVWIDTDEERLVLVFRGSAPLPNGSTRTLDRADVWLDDLDAPRGLDDVRRDLQRGHFAYAIEEDDLDDILPEPPPERVAEIRYSLWSHAPEPAITLEQYARVSAELQEKREPRDVTLRRHDLDEDRWGVEERAWMEKMSAGAMRGDASTAARYGDLFVAAQDELAGDHEAARTIDDYAAVRAALDRGAETTKALAHFEMTLPAWMRLDRRFTGAAAKDGALAAEIERRVAAAEVDPELLVEDPIGGPQVDEAAT